MPSSRWLREGEAKRPADGLDTPPPAARKQAQLYADKHGLVFLGLYAANERLGDQAIPHGAQKMADALRKERSNAFVLVVSDVRRLYSTHPTR